jgi:hypothetical protein
MQEAKHGVLQGNVSLHSVVALFRVSYSVLHRRVTMIKITTDTEGNAPIKHVFQSRLDTMSTVQNIVT